MTTTHRTAPLDLEGALRAHIRAAQDVVDMLPAIRVVAAVVCDAFAGDGRLFAFGNGGSAAEAQHLVAEFSGRFLRTRRPLPAMSLTTDASVVTGIGNDFGFEMVFARQVRALARRGDVVIAFTTSGRSRNVLEGLAAARDVGATTVLFGSVGGASALVPAHYQLLAASGDTARAQEIHLAIQHGICDAIDEEAAR